MQTAVLEGERCLDRSTRENTLSVANHELSYSRRADSWRVTQGRYKKAGIPSPLRPLAHMAPKSARKGDRKANHPSPIPRTLTKDELFLATLRSGITDGNLFNTKLYTYSRRTPSAVDKPRPVYANEAALKHASDYFVSCALSYSVCWDISDILIARLGTVFDWDFQEGRMSTEDYDYMSDSDLEDADEPASDLSDSCKERDTAKATKNQVDGTDDTSASVTPASEEVSRASR